MIIADEEILTCKCGGELIENHAGDESVLRCGDCCRFWMQKEDWMCPAKLTERQFSSAQQAMIDAWEDEAIAEGREG